MSDRITSAEKTGRLHEGVDRVAARGIVGSATAKDGRTQIHGFPCPREKMYLSADRHLWCPVWTYDQKKIGELLSVAFPKR